MSKGIRSYPKSQQEEIVRRRLANGTGGLGYLAAQAYRDWKDKQSKKNK